MFMSRHNRELREKLQRYLGAARESVAALAEGLRHYAAHGIDAHFEALAGRSNAAEHDADGLRRAIEIELFARSLLPDSREDLLLLLERVDLMPNQARDVLRQIYVQNLSLPPFVLAPLIELADVGLKAFDLVVEGIGDVLGRHRRIQEITRHLDDAEQVGDGIQHSLVAQIFRSDLPTGERILVRDLVTAAGQVCDFAQDVGLFLTVFSVKRHV
jgi:hypothetical protein